MILNSKEVIIIKKLEAKRDQSTKDEQVMVF